MKKKLEIRVGTSGWNYRHWRERFYPAGLPVKRWFEHFSKNFDTVEINNTFYSLPEESTFDHWREQAPPRFLYAVKASRFLTHVKKLKDVPEALERFLTRARHLSYHLGPILYQLPPRWRLDAARLEEFCSLLPRDLLHVIEFREKSWLAEPAYKVLERHGVCLCIHDLLPDHPKLITGKAVYVRFHGAGQLYGGSYSEETLKKWAEWFKEALAKGHAVYAYFNNDIDAHAIRNAQQLRDFLEGD